MAQREFGLPDKRPPPNFEAFRNALSTVTTSAYIKRNHPLHAKKEKKYIYIRVEARIKFSSTEKST